jgi:signal transduction histidine kinase
MGALRTLMGTTTARLSALYLLLFTLCAVILVFYMTSLSVRFFVNQTRETINSDVTALTGTYERGGLPALVRAIDRRSRQPGANLYLIADPAGRILAGNVEAIEGGVLDKPGWRTEPFQYQRFNSGQREGREFQAIARVMEVPNGLILMVGRDLGEPERFRVVVRRALGFALGLMALGGFLIWYFVGRRALKRINDVSVASQRIMAGDLTQRLPVTGASDEFDRLSANLNTMLARISELNEGVRQVSGNIAHDLKTPLARLRNHAEAALSGDKTKAQYRAALEQTIAESDAIIRTFNAILMISRLEAGNSSESMDRIDLRQIMAEVHELYEPVAEEAGAALTVESGPPLPVTGNRELVAQALSNLVDNAIKYAGTNGQAAEVALSAASAGANTTVTVRDNGPGIPEADRERVTERFVRLEESRTQPGAGLGLALAKAVMKLHRGRIEFADAAPGLEVRLVFPSDIARQAR